MIDNFKLIKENLKFETEDDFYHLQILKRKKEHPELGSNSYVVKTYYVTSTDYLETKKEEIIHLCNFHNARACINLNRRSFEKMAFHTLRKVTDQIMNKDYRSTRKVYESVCGSHSNELDKKWIVDIDTKNISAVTYAVEVMGLCDPLIGIETIYMIVETKNGFHLITRPFNTKQFQEYYTQKNVHECPDIHKNNPTILYIP